MQSFSDFLQQVWKEMRAVKNASELISHVTTNCVKLSSDWHDDHNAAELLMGGWSHLHNIGPRDASEYLARIRELPNFTSMCRQKFFIEWLQSQFDVFVDGRTDSAPSRLNQLHETAGSNVHEEIDFEAIQNLHNVDFGSPEPQTIRLTIPPGTLTSESYRQLCYIAYKDALQAASSTPCIGGFVALADTNAEVQAFNARNNEQRHSPSLVFRNAAALNLEVITTAEALPNLAQKGIITILDVNLG